MSTLQQARETPLGSPRKDQPAASNIPRVRAIVVLLLAFVVLVARPSSSAWFQTEASSTGTGSGLAHQAQGIAITSVQSSPGVFSVTLTVDAGIDQSCGALGVVSASDASGTQLETGNGHSTTQTSTVVHSSTSSTYVYTAPPTATAVSLGGATFCSSNINTLPVWAQVAPGSSGNNWTKSGSVWSKTS